MNLLSPASITIPAGSSTATLDVIPVDDIADEPNESVIVILSGVSYGGAYSVEAIVHHRFPGR